MLRVRSKSPVDCPLGKSIQNVLLVAFSVSTPCTLIFPSRDLNRTSGRLNLASASRKFFRSFWSIVNEIFEPGNFTSFSGATFKVI